MTAVLPGTPNTSEHPAALEQLRALAAEIRALHEVIPIPGGATICDHCCRNRLSHRTFACYESHNHRALRSPCPTLQILDQAGL